MIRLWTCCFISIVSAAAASTAAAQGYFGQNQVQYDKFNWRVKETEHFFVHYYPEEAVAAEDAARMAERAYAKLSRIIGYQFREKKPLVLFASRGDFGQNNVLGDLGEGTGGVTEGLRHRVLLPFTGDYQSFEQVLTHELVHSFQYDIFARGKAGAGLQTMQEVNPPLWFMEGMAEYLSTGPGHRLTDAWIRDATLNGKLPSIEEMTARPDLYFPYRYGEALWAWIGERWGDEVIGQILQGTPNVGIERAIKRETGLSIEDLSDEWREAMQVKHLPSIPQYQRPRKFAKPMLTERLSGADIFVAPALSHDGKMIAFISTGSFMRGEVFFDLWLGNAETGKRIKRLVKSTTDPDFEELRLIYSQSSFSPDGRLLAFTAQRQGRDVLYLLDVRQRETVKRFELPLEGVTSPSFSPDSRRIVFSGGKGGLTDLYVVDVDGKNLQQLTDDRYGDLQPQWSPDGRTIAFASDRGDGTNLDLLQFNRWRLTLLDLETRRVDVPPNQDGLNLNPMWAPDGKSIAFISDRTGIANVFLYDIQQNEHYQLTNVVGAVSAIAEYSPAITWSRGADRLAFTYFEDGTYSVWSTDNPRALKQQPYRDAGSLPRIVADGPASASSVALPAAEAKPLPPAPVVSSASVLPPVEDSLPRRQSLYRTGSTVRASDELPSTRTAGAPMTVAAILDSAAFALPDPEKFKDYKYKGSFAPEFVGRPQIGYTTDNFGRGVSGGSSLILSDMLGNHRLAFAGGLNGRLSDAQVFAAYSNVSHRWQYITGVMQEPYYFYSGDRIDPLPDGVVEQHQFITRYIQRQAFGISQYPLNRFTRLEAGLSYNHVDRSTVAWVRQIDTLTRRSSQMYVTDPINEPGIHYVQPNIAFVSDNALFGYTGPIMGRRYRFQVQPTLGSFQWMEYLADYRRYDPVIFNFITIATRFTGRFAVGRDEGEVPVYIGRPELLRGYNRESYTTACIVHVVSTTENCGAARLIGSRVAVANAEIRFPLVRRFDLGLLPVALPPVDGLVFYDVGVAWSGGQDIELKKPSSQDLGNVRYPLRSYGFGVRLNLFNFALARWDYAVPLDVDRGGFWTFSLGPSF